MQTTPSDWPIIELGQYFNNFCNFLFHSLQTGRQHDSLTSLTLSLHIYDYYESLEQTLNRNYTKITKSVLLLNIFCFSWRIRNSHKLVLTWDVNDKMKTKIYFWSFCGRQHGVPPILQTEFLTGLQPKENNFSKLILNLKKSLLDPFICLKAIHKKNSW